MEHRMSDDDALTPLGLEDARILALEVGSIRGHTLKVLLLDDAPGDDVVAALRDELARRLPDAPRWRQRLVRAPGTPTGFAWQDDPAFDVAWHVIALGDGPVDDEGLRRLLADVMKERLDRARPLWRLYVVPRLTDGRWALVWKVHHALADGATMMRAGARLLWTDETSPTTTSSRRTSGTPRPGTHDGTKPEPQYRGLVLREFRRIRLWQLSPLAAKVGDERAVAFARCTLDELRAIGKAVGPDVTVNDVLLAVVAGALRRWLEGRRAPRARIKAQVPVSLHAVADDAGNRDSFLLVELPVHESDPVARVRAVHAATRLRKRRQDALAIDAFRGPLARAPAVLRRWLQRMVQGPHEYSVNVSNVPGPSGHIDVLGHRVDELYSIAEIAPRHALRIAAVSMGGVLHVGLCADPDVVPDLDVFAAGIREAVDELEDETGSRPPKADDVLRDATVGPG